MKMFEPMSPERLEELIARFSAARIAVLGDFFLDKYLDIDPELAERSVETGKIAHQVVGIRHSPGAAGTVVSNLAALGAGDLEAIGLTGDDGESWELRRDLNALGCRTNHLHRAADRWTPTYLKPRDRRDPSLAGEHSRYDTKNRTPTPAAIERQIIESLQAVLASVDAVIALDQVYEEDCGVVTAAVRAALARAAAEHPHVVFWADSRQRIRQFRRLTVKANQFEVAGNLHLHRLGAGPETDLDQTVAIEELCSALQAMKSEVEAPVFATLGAAGMIVSDPVLTFVPGVRVEGPTDPTGAGDSATAGAVLALAAGASCAEAALVGNLVASITVEQLATTGTASRPQLPPRLSIWLSQRAAAARNSASGLDGRPL